MTLWKPGCVVIALFALSFVLAGAAPQENQEQKDSKAAESKQEEVKADPAKGKEVFEANCSICHTADSEDVVVGPGLKGLFKKGPHKLADGTEHKEHTVEIIRNQIVKGSSAMPPMGEVVTGKDLDNLLAFLQTL